jgi:hypothetical protein
MRMGRSLTGRCTSESRAKSVVLEVTLSVVPLNLWKIVVLPSRASALRTFFSTDLLGDRYCPRVVWIEFGS